MMSSSDMDKESSATGANPSDVVEEDIAARVDDRANLRRQNQELALRNQELALQIQELRKRLASRSLPSTELLQSSMGGKCSEAKMKEGYGTVASCEPCAGHTRNSEKRVVCCNKHYQFAAHGHV